MCVCVSVCVQCVCVQCVSAVCVCFVCKCVCCVGVGVSVVGGKEGWVEGLEDLSESGLGAFVTTHIDCSESESH